MAERNNEAWINIPSEQEIRNRVPRGGIGVYEFDFVPAMTRLLGAHNDIGLAFIQLYKEIMIAPSHLNRADREMIASVAASAQDCFY